MSKVTRVMAAERRNYDALVAGKRSSFNSTIRRTRDDDQPIQQLALRRVFRIQLPLA